MWENILKLAMKEQLTVENQMQELQNNAQIEQLDYDNQKIWLKIQLLQVLCKGRLKPNKPSNQNRKTEDSIFHKEDCYQQSTVSDSFEFIGLINSLCKSLEKDLELNPMARIID